LSQSFWITLFINCLSTYCTCLFILSSCSSYCCFSFSISNWSFVLWSCSAWYCSRIFFISFSYSCRTFSRSSAKAFSSVTSTAMERQCFYPFRQLQFSKQTYNLQLNLTLKMFYVSRSVHFPRHLENRLEELQNFMKIWVLKVTRILELLYTFHSRLLNVWQNILPQLCS
jgi:hypothetical protein